MKSKDMAAYVPIVEQMADTALCFLKGHGISFPDAYPLPELRLSLERRTKLYGIYNKRNVLAELRRVQNNISITVSNDLCRRLDRFLHNLQLFLEGASSAASGFSIWQALKSEYKILEDSFNEQGSTGCEGTGAKFWQQIRGLYTKVNQLEIRQELSGVFSSEGRIVIYMNNIDAICQSQNLPLKFYLQSVLVHEYTHACHYADFMRQQNISDAEGFSLEKSLLRWSGANFGVSRASCVKESLARYMQAIWCREQDIDLANRLFADAYGEYVIQPNWPYAGAQELLLLEQEAGLKLFQNIWKASLTEWEQAYELLGVVD